MNTQKRCKECNKKLINVYSKFCSRKCYYNYIAKHKYLDIICLNCNKKIPYKIHTKFCSCKCSRKYHFDITHEKIKCLCCNKMFLGYKNYKSKFCSRLCCDKYAKKYKINAFHNPKIQKNNAIKSNITNKKNGTCFYNKKLNVLGRTAANKSHKINKTGWYNSKLQSEMGKRGGSKTAEILRNRYGYPFKGINFASMKERELGVNIWYQFGKLVVGKNYQFKVGTKRYDFFINKCFIEFHQITYYSKEDMQTYKKYRRTNLDINGFKEYPLIIIDDI